MDVRTALEAITADAARGDIVFPTHTEIALRVQRLLDDPDITGTDLMATVPLATGARFVQLGMVELLRLPFTPPSFAVQQHWHPLVRHDARSQWLRRQVAMLFNVESDEWRGLQTSLYGSVTQPSTRSTKRTSTPTPKPASPGLCATT